MRSAKGLSRAGGRRVSQQARGPGFLQSKADMGLTASFPKNARSSQRESQPSHLRIASKKADAALEAGRTVDVSKPIGKW